MPSQSQTQEQPSSHPSLLTLAIASASSVVAAILVSKLWGPGTIIGAAATPVIVTFVGELLKKPAEKITVVRVSPSGTQVHERTAPPPPASGDLGERSVHRSRRRPLAIALATGLAAFAIGAVVLTSSELVFGDASVASGGKRTTVFGGGTQERPTPREEEREKQTPSTESQTTTTTTTVPAPASPPETTPPATTVPLETGTGPTGAAPPPPATGATTP